VNYNDIRVNLKKVVCVIIYFDFGEIVCLKAILALIIRLNRTEKKPRLPLYLGKLGFGNIKMPLTREYYIFKSFS
jgi:hypothetical protein